MKRLTPRKSNDDCPFGPALQKYWERRYDLFSRFDDGIQVDETALFSTKPEIHAADIAARLPGCEVIDAFCGVGGVAIALARLGKKVIAVDIDAERLRMAMENAKIYRCEHNITFVEANFLEYARHHGRVTSIYIDPPWGGPEYFRKDVFRLGDFVPDGASILQASLPIADLVAMTVPTNFGLDEMKAYGSDFAVRMSHAWGRELFMTLYIDAARYRVSD